MDVVVLIVSHELMVTNVHQVFGTFEKDDRMAVEKISIAPHRARGVHKIDVLEPFSSVGWGRKTYKNPVSAD